MSLGKILIVDDDRHLCFILRAHLVNAGFECQIGNSGREAIALATTTLPDVIVLDVQLPEMDGFEITRTLRATPETTHIPVILLTGRTGRDDLVLGLDAGAQDYVRKPFDVTELTARVRSMLKLSQAQQRIDELNNRLLNEIHHKTGRIELLYSFVRDLNRAASVERIYDLVVETAQKATSCRRVSVMVFDPIQSKLVCRRAIGIDPRVAERVSVDSNAGIAGQVYTTGATVVAKTVDAVHEDDRQYASDSFMSTPIVSTYMVSGEQRMGVLNATDKPNGEPFTPEEVECLRSIADSAAIALHNEERRSGLTRSIRALLLTVGRLSEYRDEETGLHLERVRDYAKILARHMATKPLFREMVTPMFIQDLHLAAPLHDVGKVGIPDEILNKPGKLTDEEFQIMKTHTTIGRHTLMLAMEEAGPVPLLQMCADIAYCHHEHFDGSGYPRGLRGNDIPLSARIITLVDAYDAMTSQRCYKRAVPHSDAVAAIRDEAGKHFDANIVEAFLEVCDEFDLVRQRKVDDVELIPELAAAVAASLA
jgi:response regulator RpfG family c-di-GMP phosphodiesterase